MTTPRIAVLDSETRSALDLRKTNAHVYASHPTTDVWLLRYAYTDDPNTTHRWSFGQPMPEDLREHVRAGGLVSAHNAGFEYSVWNLILTPRYGWEPIGIEQMTDTAARAARCGLPRKLELVAKSLGLAQQKDMTGNAQMKKMAKPRKVRHIDLCGGMDEAAVDAVEHYEQIPAMYTVIYDGDEATIYEWWATGDRIERLGLYCDDDVRTQMELELLLPQLPEREHRIWLTTMQANIRGVQLDMAFIRQAVAVINQRLEAYAHELLVLTHGQVKSHTDLNGMKSWLAAQDVGFDAGGSLDKNVVAEMLADESLPQDVRRVVGIRAEAGKSSVAKFPAMLNHADEHGVARDQLVYYGATATGRWSGQGIQLQNLPSRGAPGYKDAEWHIDHLLQEPDVETGIDALELMEDGSAVETLSMCLRGAITARQGTDMVCADYSNIEGRKAAWLGGEQWKLDAFRDYDAGTGPDLYLVAAGGILGMKPGDVSKTMRNAVGKVSELALQFQGGVGAFLSMAANYRVEIADYWDDIRASVSPHILDEVKEAWEQFGKYTDIDRITWFAAEAVKRAWREKHPGIVRSWYECENSALAAVDTPGKPFYACDGKVAFLSKGLFRKHFLLMRLPSGRCIHYPKVKIQPKRTPWGAMKDMIVFDKVEQGRVLRSNTYGGDLFQSCLSKGTLVLTDLGWTPIEEITPLHRVWDGEKWVLQDGVALKGWREVMDLAGVTLTPDHKVLTNEGWKDASSCAGYYRAESRLPHSYRLRGLGWKEIPLANPLRLRDRENVFRERLDKGTDQRTADVLRMQTQRDHTSEHFQTWAVTPPSVRRVGLHAGKMLQKKQRQLSELWSAWHRSLRTLAKQLYRVLRGHGRYLHARADLGKTGCKQRVQPGELRLASVESPVGEQTKQHLGGGQNCERDFSRDRHSKEHALLPSKKWVPFETLDGGAGPGPHLQEVYDLLNCGPRNRFVVRDSEGLPIIVHNCTQGGARDIMAHGWLNAEDAGYQGLFSVHDELAAEYAEGRANLREFEQLLCDIPDWAEDLPVTAEGYISKRFRKD